MRESLIVRQVALPFMENIVKKTKESAHLVCHEGKDGLFTDSIHSDHSDLEQVTVGTRCILSKGAPKKVILSFLEESIKRDIINELYDDKSAEDLKKELQIIKSCGYAISHGDFLKGTSIVSAPIFSWDNQVLASISISGPENRFRKSTLKSYITTVKTEAAKISRELGYWTCEKI